MTDFATSPWLLPLSGLIAGTVMGYAARHRHFCTMAALERHWYAADSRGLRIWVLAAAVALVLTQLLARAGYADIEQSFYLTSQFGWTGSIIGGLAFGFGMALVGTCGFGALVRIGGGSLRSLVVLMVLGLSALAAQRGLVALGRVQFVDNLALDLSSHGGQSLGALVSSWVGIDLNAAVATMTALTLLAWVFSDRRFQKEYGAILTAAIIGAVVAFGWVATTFATHHSFEPVQIEAGSFVVPVADAFLQFIAYTGTLPDYGVGLVVGVVVGAAICAMSRKDMRWEACDDARELGRHLWGGFLMGAGGVFAMGCTIGQGISAVSVLAISAPLVMASIALGARMGLSYLIEGSPFAVFRPTRHEPAE